MEDISNKAAPHEIYIQGIKAEERKKRRNRTLLILGLILILGTGFTIFSWNKPGSIEYKKLNFNELTSMSEKDALDQLKNKRVNFIVYDFDRGRLDTIANTSDYYYLVGKGPTPPDNDGSQGVDPNDFLPETTQPLQEFALEIVGDQKAGSVLSIMISDYDPNIEYELDYGNGMVKRAKEINMYMYKEAGQYDLKLIARDNTRESTSNLMLKIEQGDPELKTDTGNLADTEPDSDASAFQNDDGFGFPTTDNNNAGNNGFEDETDNTVPPVNNTATSVVDNQISDNDKTINQTIADNQTGSQTDISLANPSTENEVDEKLSENVKTDPPLLENGLESFDGEQTKKEEQIAESSGEENVGKPTVEEAEAPLSIKGPLIAVETMPSFPGGERAMYSYLNDRIRYPQQARDYEVEGKVYVQFVVDQDGKVTEPKVVKGLGYGCDEEALRIVRLMPLWMPGKHRQQRVPVIYTLPVTFQFR